ncbi:MAG: ribbon-helix-helix protein, CopG family [archaeon]|nr:ribbon-helix-helix protein, CopG family [archaeon]
MKIVTVNLPVPYIKSISDLVGENGLYPSRSELIRVAIRDFLIQELEIAKKFPEFVSEEQQKSIIENEPPVLDSNFVRIPTENSVGVNSSKEYKTYRIIQR